jgi:tetratricopeptide (TPR) repeat protein
MLNLAEGLLWMGRTQQQLGRTRDALTILSRLTRFRELPPGVAEETQARLGEIQLQRKRFRRAGRHFTVALRYDPDNARYHQLLAASLRDQGKEQYERAAEHYRRALELNPEQVESLTGLGLLYLRMGKTDEGIAQLRKAVDHRANEPEVLAKLVKGLRWAGRSEEARQALRVGLFRNPRDRRFQQLWADFQFHQLRREQLRRRQKKGSRNQEGPVLLPFQAQERSTSGCGTAITPSSSTSLPVPLPAQPRGSQDQRKIQ